ncbi:MAG: hypothetical protein IPO62_10270 [Saprospiraceae bacterium]|nr:hypothetical protein [Saprospiraceae bacterium]
MQEANGRKNILPILRAWKVKAGAGAETGIITANANQGAGGSLVGETKVILEIGLWNIKMNRSIRIGIGVLVLAIRNIPILLKSNNKLLMLVKLI